MIHFLHDPGVLAALINLTAVLIKQAVKLYEGRHSRALPRRATYRRKARLGYPSNVSRAILREVSEGSSEQDFG